LAVAVWRLSGWAWVGRACWRGWGARWRGTLLGWPRTAIVARRRAGNRGADAAERPPTGFARQNPLARQFGRLPENSRRSSGGRPPHFPGDFPIDLFDLSRGESCLLDVRPAVEFDWHRLRLRDQALINFLCSLDRWILRLCPGVPSLHCILSQFPDPWIIWGGIKTRNASDIAPEAGRWSQGSARRLHRRKSIGEMDRPIVAVSALGHGAECTPKISAFLTVCVDVG
jgi:hypothetical protein